LDCVWQLLQQFPEDFEFSETMLTTIWDSVFLPIFDTFQFNSEYDRHLATHNDRLVSVNSQLVFQSNVICFRLFQVLRPVWDWGEQYTDKDIALFSNPMYKKPQATEQDIETFRRSRLPPSAFRLPGLDDLNKKKPENMRQSRIPQAMSTSLVS
jgi:myotubularin-related protein 10/11/12